MRLTHRNVQGLKPRDDRYTAWDDQLKGFGVRVNPGGYKAYILKTRINGKQRKITIGDVEKLKPDAARKKAQEFIGSAVVGVDKFEEKRLKDNEPTIDMLADRFLKEYIPHHIKPSTAADYKRSIEKFIRPLLGSKKTREITREEIASFHNGFSKTPYQANRVLGTLSIMLTQAEIWGMRDEGINPCLKIKRFKELKRERYLSAEELMRLDEALQFEATTAPVTAAAFRLLILTGCRLGEIQKLEWKDVYLDRKEIRLPDAKSKTGARSVYLSDQGVEILKSLPRPKDNPYVIIGTLPGAYLADFQKPWRRIRRAAGLEDVRIHDLRHTFASIAAANGLSLPMIGKLLGHTQAQTTARYAHLAADPIREANSGVSDVISRNMNRHIS